MNGRPRILVIRPRDGFALRLEEAGCDVLNLELIRTEASENPAPLKAALSGPDKYDGLFFTSPAAAEVFVKVVDSFAGKIYVLGERAKTILEEAGFDVLYREFANTAEELIGSFDESEFASGRFLYLCGDRSMRTIPRLLGKKAVVDELIVYRTVKLIPDSAVSKPIRENLENGEIDWICFFSPSAVESFRDHFGSVALNGIKAAAIGKTTAESASASYFDVGFVSKKANSAEFANGLIEHIKSID